MSAVRVIRINPAAGSGGEPSAPGAPMLRSLPPLSLYVHFPWCVRKCPYCDFNSHEVRGEIPEDAYVDALTADLESALPAVWGRRVATVFVGGGTPSLMSAKALGRVLAAIRSRLPLAPDAEITLEANPGAIDAERFEAFRETGVTRLSIGVQSFDETLLPEIGRIHGADDGRRAVDLGLRHFERVNVDLMYGLPGQSLRQSARDIETAVRSGAGHVSAYVLTLEPNTPFHNAPPKLPDPDLVADMQDQAETLLASHGFEHYEVSAFARPGERCRHNLNYWLFGDYMGIGAGAHGKLSFHDRIVREVRHRHPRAYLEALPRGDFVASTGTISPRARPLEFMMNALRLPGGFPLRLFIERTGLPASAIEPVLAAAEKDGLLARDLEDVRPTPRGLRFLNDLLSRFVPD